MRPFELQPRLRRQFVDDRFTTDINDAQVKSFTVYSLDAGYNFEVEGVKSMRVQLDVYNLFDEEFFRSMQTAPGLPRISRLRAAAGGLLAERRRPLAAQARRRTSTGVARSQTASR
jgi:outer membrane receptor protein involved in Fe transport